MSLNEGLMMIDIPYRLLIYGENLNKRKNHIVEV